MFRKVHFLCFWLITFEPINELHGKNQPLFADLNEMRLPSNFKSILDHSKRAEMLKTAIVRHFKFVDFTKNHMTGFA